MSKQLFDISDEAHLLKKIKAGDERAFEVIFRRYYPHLVLFAQRYLLDKDLSESLVQGVFVKIWEMRNKQEIHSIKGFLVVAVRNQCHNELKHRSVVKGYEKTEAQKEDIEWPVYDESNYLNLINQVIDELPEQRRKIFTMSRMDGLKYREIADALNISPKTVEAQMGKALKYLRENLQPLKKQLMSLFL